MAVVVVTLKYPRFAGHAVADEWDVDTDSLKYPKFAGDPIASKQQSAAGRKKQVIGGGIIGGL